MPIDFPSLFKAQEKFDQRFTTLDTVETIRKKFVALSVELSEAIAERPDVFKYWSKSKIGATQKAANYYAKKYNQLPEKIEKDPLLEELADILHFIISIAIDLKIDPQSLSIRIPYEKETIELYLDFNFVASQLYLVWDLSNINGQIAIANTVNDLFQDLINKYFGFVQSLGYDITKIEEAYYEKNLINHMRQKNGY